MSTHASDLNSSVDQHIKLRATARNAKAGAVAITDDGQVIYIKDTPEWDRSQVGKPVTLHGTLRRGSVYPGTTTDDGQEMQGIDGDQWYLELDKPSGGSL